MNKNRIERIVDAMFAACIAAILVVAVISIRRVEEETARCKQAGGVYVRGFCLDGDVVIFELGER